MVVPPDVDVLALAHRHIAVSSLSANRLRTGFRFVELTMLFDPPVMQSDDLVRELSYFGIVLPLFPKFSEDVSTIFSFASSRLPVGSSARMMPGSLISALAMQTSLLAA